MLVEIKIDPELTEPHAVLYIPKLTAEISELVNLLERKLTGTTMMLSAKKDDKSYIIEPEQAELIRTEGGEVVLYTTKADRFKLDKSLHEIQQRLGNNFIRISKSTIVNIRRIDHVSQSFNGTMDIIMKNGINDYISRKYLSDFKKRLGL